METCKRAVIQWHLNEVLRVVFINQPRSPALRLPAALSYNKTIQLVQSLKEGLQYDTQVS